MKSLIVCWMLFVIVLWSSEPIAWQQLSPIMKMLNFLSGGGSAIGWLRKLQTGQGRILGKLYRDPGKTDNFSWPAHYPKAKEKSRYFLKCCAGRNCIERNMVR